jgi:hypothetical protein
MRSRVWLIALLSLFVLAYTTPQIPVYATQTSTCCCQPSECGCGSNCCGDSTSADVSSDPFQLMWESTGCKGEPSNSGLHSLGSKVYILFQHRSLIVETDTSPLFFTNHLGLKGIRYVCFRPPQDLFS